MLEEESLTLCLDAAVSCSMTAALASIMQSWNWIMPIVVVFSHYDCSNTCRDENFIIVSTYHNTCIIMIERLSWSYTLCENKFDCVKCE